MKKTRLLEIIREEISSALNEAGLGDQITALEKQKDALEKQKSPLIKKEADLTKKIADLQKKEADAEVKSSATLEEEKRKKLAEKYQLDEDTINEMASVIQTKKVLTKLGDEEKLQLVKDVEKETLDQFKKNPIVSSDGRLARKLDPEEISGKRDTRGYGADFERNFKKKAGMDFLDFTTQIDIELKKKFPEEKFTPGLATNTTEKDAANQITGKTPDKKGPKGPTKSKEEKPAKEKPAKAEKASKSEPKTKETTSSDDEAPSGDIEVEKAARNRDELIKQYKSEVEPYLKDKIAAKDMEWLKSKQDIIKKYNQAKQVNV